MALPARRNVHSTSLPSGPTTAKQWFADFGRLSPDERRKAVEIIESELNLKQLKQAAQKLGRPRDDDLTFAVSAAAALQNAGFHWPMAAWIMNQAQRFHAQRVEYPVESYKRMAMKFRKDNRLKECNPEELLPKDLFIGLLAWQKPICKIIRLNNKVSMESVLEEMMRATIAAENVLSKRWKPKSVTKV